MNSVCGRYCITYNGEVYNYRELREELRELGARLETESDTEVLLEAFRHWGEDAALRLVGIFACAIWDRQESRLTLLRDHLGVKPLYYAILPRGPAGEGAASLAFASEPKALLTLPAVDRRPSAAAIDAYLGLFYVPPPWSIFAGIRQLPPGHLMTWHQGQITIRRYWDPQPAPEEGLGRDEWAEVIAPVLQAAIVSNTLADPGIGVGAFLSGGVDSSTVVAVMAARQRRLTTVCVGYTGEDAGFDERREARRVAEFFGTLHHELVLGPEILDGGAETIVGGFDEPFGSWTALLAWHLCRFTRGMVKVAVGGDGGDEVFGGYPRYRGIRLSGLGARAPTWGLRGLAWTLGLAGEGAGARSYRRWARSFVAGCAQPEAARYAGYVGYFSPAERDRLLTPDLREALRAEVQGMPGMSGMSGMPRKARWDPVAAAFARPAAGDAVARAIYADLQGFLPENVLRSSDRMGMAHGLEVRVPLCDRRLVELLARVPSRHQVGWWASKRLLKGIVGERLPPEVCRRRKLGFNAPFSAWLRRPAVAGRLRPGLRELAGVNEPAEVDRLWHEHSRGARDHGPKLWALAVLGAWLRRYGAG